MIDLGSPEWSGPIGTGLFGTAYALGDGRSFVLVGAPGAAVGSRADRTWPWIIMQGRQRDFAFEEELRRNERLAVLTAVQVIHGDQLFTAREGDLSSVVRIVQEAAGVGTGGCPDRRAAM